MKHCVTVLMEVSFIGETVKKDELYLGYDQWLPSPPKVQKPRSVFNAASLAYIGDCIYEVCLYSFLLMRWVCCLFNSYSSILNLCKQEQILVQLLMLLKYVFFKWFYEVLDVRAELLKTCYETKILCSSCFMLREKIRFVHFEPGNKCS